MEINFYLTYIERQERNNFTQPKDDLAEAIQNTVIRFENVSSSNLLNFLETLFENYSYLREQFQQNHEFMMLLIYNSLCNLGYTIDYRDYNNIFRGFFENLHGGYGIEQ